MSSPSRPEEVLSFWFGDVDSDGLATEDVSQRWWLKSASFDREVDAKFGTLWQDVVDGQHEDWLAAPRSLLAYVIVLDQFSRNLSRDDPRAFEQDDRALGAAASAIDRGWDLELAGHLRVFLYMPFMHSEDLMAQEKAVALFSAFRDSSMGKLRAALEPNVDFAVQHRNIVARFRRFPHRNAVLGRTSTAEESEFLQQPGSSF
jgi:uncharacterized protein (DUF924 family)